jgi:hypothetical protein
VKPQLEACQRIAETAERDDRSGKLRLNLTVFVSHNGGVDVYTSQVGTSGEDVRAVEPRLQCSSRLDATGAFGEILRLCADG